MSTEASSCSPRLWKNDPEGNSEFGGVQGAHCYTSRALLPTLLCWPRCGLKRLGCGKAMVAPWPPLCRAHIANVGSVHVTPLSVQSVQTLEAWLLSSRFQRMQVTGMGPYPGRVTDKGPHLARVGVQAERCC